MRWLILSLALLSYAAAAQMGQQVLLVAGNETDEQAPGEEKLVLPAFPKNENLVRIQVDGGGNFDFFVDLESVSVGHDGIVRYTLLARSVAGATNITYEGIQCKSRERKFYAFGRQDRNWTIARDPRWIPISIAPRDMAEATLHDAYFCPDWTMVRDANEAKRVLREGGASRATGWADR